MLRSTRAAVLAILALFAMGLAGRDVAAKGDKLPKTDPKLAAAIEAAVRKSGGDDFWGTVLVASKGQVAYVQGFGFADYEKKPNAPDSLFEIASTSKQFTATAILRLEQQKKLKTTDTLDKYFPKAAKDKKKVTIDHLLHHTSGLDSKLGVPYDWGGARDQYAEQMLAPALVDVPGEKWSYSNVGYALLAAIVEVVTNGSFEDYCRKELFAPAGLKDTGFVQDRDLIKSDRITKRKCDDGLPSWTAADWHYGWGYRGMGGVVSTALDLLAWDRALRGTKILGEAAKKKLYTPTLEKYACGWIVEPGERGGTKVAHSGSVGGYRMQFARWLEDDLVVIVLTNDKEDPHAVEHAVTAAYLANR